jgi:mutator family transposase
MEALNRQLRKAIKTKGHFPNEEAARKLIYLAIVNAVPAWTRTRNWTTALLAFKIHFGERLPESIAYTETRTPSMTQSGSSRSLGCEPRIVASAPFR